MWAKTVKGQRVYITTTHVESVRSTGDGGCVVCLVSGMEYKFPFPLTQVVAVLGLPGATRLD